MHMHLMTFWAAELQSAAGADNPPCASDRSVKV